MIRWLMCAAVALLLAGCGERAQTSVARKADAQAWQGAASDPYAAAGWKAGDATSWEQQLRSRAIYGQNEYTRTAP
jgi:hypothetical protein